MITPETWSQLRKTMMLVWALGVVTYLVVFAGSTTDAAIGLINLAIAGIGAKFIE